jgi:hypothetical protein
MNTLKSAVLVFFIFFSMPLFANEVEQRASVKVVDSQYGNLFVFKVARTFKGATVEVYYSNGDLVATKTMGKRRMIINFCDVKSGSYTIRVRKENKVEEFKYFRK